MNALTFIENLAVDGIDHARRCMFSTCSSLRGLASCSRTPSAVRRLNRGSGVAMASAAVVVATR
jgi:hypothetical protein